MLPKKKTFRKKSTLSMSSAPIAKFCASWAEVSNIKVVYNKIPYISLFSKFFTTKIEQNQFLRSEQGTCYRWRWKMHRFYPGDFRLFDGNKAFGRAWLRALSARAFCGKCKILWKSLQNHIVSEFDDFKVNVRALSARNHVRTHKSLLLSKSMNQIR